MGGRPTAGRTPRVTAPGREVVEARVAEARWSVTEGAREVVEVTDDEPDVLYVIERSGPAYSGPSRIDTSGADPGDVLIAGDDTVIRPGPLELDDLADVEVTGDGVLTRDGSGPVRFRPLPPARPLPQRHTQQTAALRWQIAHGLGYRPGFVVHTTDGGLISPENVEHPVPGSISELVFGAPFAGYADPS